MLQLGKRVAATVSVVLAASLPALAVFFTAAASPDAPSDALPVSVVADSRPAFSLDAVEDDVLWLARCIYSETKQPHEQELVAWVVRNRVETAYRGVSTYEGTVLDPYQFSAFNPGYPRRALYMNLTPASVSPGWQRALEIAHEVYHAPAAERPFPLDTRHFYSERSMVGRRAPVWADGRRPVQNVKYQVDPRRFRFFSGIAAATRL
ncbi:MAG: hypothetical protein ACK41D_00640 [Rubricoccaceae bacterium]